MFVLAFVLAFFFAASVSAQDMVTFMYNQNDCSSNGLIVSVFTKLGQSCSTITSAVPKDYSCIALPNTTNIYGQYSCTDEGLGVYDAERFVPSNSLGTIMWNTGKCIGKPSQGTFMAANGQCVSTVSPESYIVTRKTDGSFTMNTYNSSSCTGSPKSTIITTNMLGTCMDLGFMSVMFKSSNKNVPIPVYPSSGMKIVLPAVLFVMFLV